MFSIIEGSYKRKLESCFTRRSERDLLVQCMIIMMTLAFVCCLFDICCNICLIWVKLDYKIL